jgi:hypothetical protein
MDCYIFWIPQRVIRVSFHGGEHDLVRVTQEALIIPYESHLLGWTTSLNYILGGIGHAILADVSAKITTTEKEAVDIIRFQARRGIEESNTAAGGIRGK